MTGNDNESARGPRPHLSPLHESICPSAHSDIATSWHVGVEKLRAELNDDLLLGGLVHVGLISIVFAIMFNLHVILRHRERGLEREKALRVVAVTADVEFLSKSETAGFNGMLLKPITRATLEALLRKVG